MSSLQDILNEELTQDNRRIIVNRVFDGFQSQSQFSGERLKTIGSSKNLNEFYALVKNAIDDYEKRAGITEENKIIFTEEDPDVSAETESIVFSLIKREPGAFSQGKPFEGNTKNLRFITRESGSDPANPGYKYVINGYFYDNVVRFTCWARTNKAANARAMWFEDLMNDYMWFFTAQGLQRVLFWGREKDMVTEINGNKWYGRPLDYFVRTEKLRVFKEKELEDIVVNLTVKSE